MFTHAQLSPSERERIYTAVPGGIDNILNVYPLTPLQQGIFFHRACAGQHDPYRLALLFEFTSHERLDAFIEAMRWVVQRHEALRTMLLWEGVSNPLQIVLASAALQVRYLSLTAEQTPGQVLTELMNDRGHHLDLRSAPLLRICAVRGSPGQAACALLQTHHLVCDAYSLRILLEEITGFMSGNGSALEPAVQFQRYAAGTLVNGDAGAAEQFFRQRLASFSGPSAPFGVADIHSRSAPCNERQLILTGSPDRKLRQTAKIRRVSVASLFHAAWALLVAAASRRHDVVFGTVLSGRSRGGAHLRSIGMFINTLPLRIDLAGLSVAELLTTTHRELFQLLQYEQTPLSLVKSCSATAPAAPLFTALLNYRNLEHAKRQSASGAAVGMQEVASASSNNYPLTLLVDDYGNSFTIGIQTYQRIDTDEALHYFRNALDMLVDALLERPNTPAASLEIIPNADWTPPGKQRVEGGGGIEPDPHRELLLAARENPVRPHVAGRLERIWSDTLGLPRIRPGDDFFELGGTSQIATRLFMRIAEEFDVQLPDAAIFNFPTIREMAELLECMLPTPSPQAPAEQREMEEGAI